MMTSRCTIRRPAYTEDGERVTEWVEQEGDNVPVWEVVDTGVPCRVDDIDPTTVRVVGGEDVIATAEVHFDATYSLLHDNDWVEVTAGEWPGGVYSLPLIPRADQKTALRPKGVQQDRPKEWA
jgi:hypothetical protein